MKFKVFVIRHRNFSETYIYNPTLDCVSFLGGEFRKTKRLTSNIIYWWYISGLFNYQHSFSYQRFCECIGTFTSEIIRYEIEIPF